MVGWYHTGPKMRASDQEINELFKRFVPRPVMVIVDVREDTVGIPTDSYFAVEEIKDVSLWTNAYVLVLTRFPMFRTAPRLRKRSYTFRRLSRRKRQRKLVLSICFETSNTQRRQPYQPGSQSSLRL